MAESSSGDPTPRTRTAALMTLEVEEEVAELESSSSSDLSCPRTSTETMVAGVEGAAEEERALHSRPSSKAAFQGSGGVAPGPERR